LAAGLSGLATMVNLPSSEGMDPDSAMRLVQVRDLLSGQGWFDLTQHRLGLGGVEMHWSRLIDAPMATLLAVAGRVVAQDTAEYLLLVVWPAIWLAVTIWACLSLSRHLGGWFATGIASSRPRAFFSRRFCCSHQIWTTTTSSSPCCC
jgi:hypothetical protein